MKNSIPEKMKQTSLYQLMFLISLMCSCIIGKSQVRDAYFGFNGVAIENFDDYGYDRGFKLLLQDDNKVLHFGMAQESASFGDRAIVMVRYLENGQLDPTFDGDGIKFVQAGSSSSTSYSSAQLQADQKILLAGTRVYDRFIKRYHTDGSLDDTFADAGTLNFSDNTDLIYTNQHFVRMVGNTHFMVFRQYKSTFLDTYHHEFSKYNLNGSLDTSFGTEGVLTLELPSESDYFLRNFEFISDGSLIISGQVTTIIDDVEEIDLAIIKLDSNGSLDISFGSNGVATHDVVVNRDMIIQEDGKIVCVGSANTNQQGTQGSMAIVRFDENGAIDTSFAEDGSTSVGISSFADYAHAVVVQPDGKIILGGSFFNLSGGSVTDCAVVRLLPDGSRDVGFGENGVFKITLASGTDQINDMVLQDDGKLVFGGFGYGQTFNMITARLVLDGIATSGHQTMCPGGSALLTAFTDDSFIGWALEDDPEVILSDQLAFTVSPTENTTYIFYSELDTLAVDVVIKTVPTVTLPNDTTLCQGESLVLDMTIPNPFYYYWSNETFDPTITVTEPGEYSITFSNQCITLKDTINIFYIEAPEVFLGNDTTLCNAEPLEIGKLALENENYLWQNGSEDSMFSVEENGVYWLEVTNDCGSYRDSIEVFFSSPPVIDLGDDLEFCEGEDIQIELMDPNLNYQWQDGSEESIISVANAGVYWVDASNSCGTVRDSITASIIPLPEFSLGDDLALCEGEMFDLMVSIPDASFSWQDESTDATFTVSAEGEYWAEVGLNGCFFRDSVYITYNAVSNANIDVTSCDSYTSPSGVYTWGESGTYLDTISNIFGCDSVLTINLNIPELDASLVLDQNTITAISSDMSYQWFDCSNELMIIDGETSSSFEAIEQGSYSVSISDGNCEVLSECIEIIIDNISDYNSSEMVLFPNPANEKTTLTNLNENMQVSIYNFQGQELGRYENNSSGQLTIDTKPLSGGVYLLNVFSKDGGLVKSFRLITLN